MQTQLQLIFPEFVGSLSHHSKLHFEPFSKSITQCTIKSVAVEKGNSISITYYSLAIDEHLVVECNVKRFGFDQGFVEWNIQKNSA